MKQKTLIHNMKRAGLMMLAMMLTTVTAGAWDGEGTSDRPFQIKEASDLAELATGVNGGNRYTNIYFEQKGDITASGSMATIGSSNHPFCGHYDGGGFTISGLTQPLFGSIKKGETGNQQYTLSEVKNLTISGAGISDVVTGGTTGILAKSVYNNVSVTNCHVVGSSLAITGGSNAKCGGLIGSVENDQSSQPLATVSGCSVTATTITNSIDGQYCGGLFGYLTSRKNVYDNYVEATLTADNKGGIAGYLSSTATSTDYHDNYYHAATGLTAIPSQTDNGETAVCALSGVPSGVTVSPAALLTRNTKSYYAVGNVVLTVDDASKAFLSFSVSGATYSVAANKKSATVTLATSDATVSAELLTISGSCGDNATWTMSDTNSDGTYEKLTISGTGRIAPYENGTAPWYADFHSTITNLVIDNGIEMIQESDFYGLTAITEVTLPASVYYIAQNAFEGCSSLARVNIKKTDGVVTLFSSNAFNGCHSSLVIVVPTPALALQYIDNEDWTAYASKLRANLGGYAFRIDGTTAADAAYQIADADDLRRLANAVNAGNGTATSGKSFRQTADIDLGGTNFPIIGNTFRGTYDGQGFAISGLSVSTNRSTVGLFGYIDGATLRGITLVQPSVTTSSPNNNLTCDVGAIVGYAYKSTIENCHALQPTVSATGTGSGAKRIGAIAGETDNSSRLTNCCYYGGNAAQAMGYGNATLTRVGRARKVTLGSGIASVSPALTVGSGSNGFRYDGTDYYREGVALTLTSDVPTTAGYTLTFSANGTAIDGETYTVNSTDGDATLTATIRSDGQQHEISYIDEDGKTAQANAIALDGTETSLAAGNYFVGIAEANFDHTVNLTGNVTLILADGATMNIGTSEEPISYGNGIKGYDENSDTGYDLTIYGQTLGTGAVNVYVTGAENWAIGGKKLTINGGNITADTDGNSGNAIAAVSNLTINGGNVTANASGNDAQAIASASDITINGGTVNATGDLAGIAATSNVTINGGNVNTTATANADSYGIATNGTITLGWSNYTDRIYASSYHAGNNYTISVKTGQKLIGEDGTIYDDATSSATLAALGGQTLRPYAETVTLKANLAPDHNRWTTFYCGYLPYTISGQACAYTAQYDAQNAQLTLSRLGTDGTVIPKATAVIIVAPEASSTVTLNVLTGDDPAAPANNDLRGLDQDTPLAQLAAGTFYVLGNKNAHFGFHRYTGAEMPARKAYLKLPVSEARSLDMVFGDATGIQTTNCTNSTNYSDEWYSLDGRKLNGKPTQKGIYVNKGHKVVIK